MLKEIRCDLFKEQGKLRPPVKFHRGLNIVLGSVPGKAGSIGKSTMLLIIDFAFGGNSYKKSDAVTQLNDHTIYFTFSFNGTDYHFARNTGEEKIVARLDESGNVVDSIAIQDFTDWLCKKYKMDLPGLSFRNSISRFFRIYGKNNLNERRPLQTRGGDEAQKDAIHVLVTLFDLYSSILSFKEMLILAEEKIKAFRAARRFEFIPSAVDGMKKYDENVAAIAQLEREREELCQADNQTINAEEMQEANKVNELNRYLQELRKRIRSKEDDLYLLRINIQQGVYPTEADLKSLREIFPEANFKKLLDIERFHSKIQVILKEELENAALAVEEELKPLVQELDELTKQVSSLRPSMAFSEEFLYAYTRLDRRINKLKDENEAFDTRNRLQEQKRQADARYQEQMKSVLKTIESTINEEMESLNEIATNGEYNAPKLTLTKFDSYDFETPKDKGTGTNNRSMILYDLAVLHSTVLPAIAHDSILFDPMSRPDLSRLIQIYEKEKEKQIFIALDKTSTCSETAQDIIARNTVIKLDNNEHALFGDKWSRKVSE